MSVELTEVRDFLTAHAPFDALPAPLLKEVVRGLEITYARRGTVLEEDVPLFVVRSGAVEVRDERGAFLERYGEGESFVGATSRRALAAEDTLLYLVPEPLFQKISSEPGFEHFFGAPDERVQLALGNIQSDAVLTTRLKDLTARAPITGTRTMTLREAAAQMNQVRVSSLLITEGERLVGILTDRDLRSRVVAQGLSFGTPVGEVMTPGPATLPGEAHALDALLTMTRRNIHHLPVTEKGKLIGMVTSTDLLRLQASSPVYLVGDVFKQEDVAGLGRISGRTPQLLVTLEGAGVAAEDVMKMLSSVKDAVTVRLLDLAERELGPPPVPYSWLVLGSQARQEASAHSDQDHALVLSDEVEEEHEAYFGALARFVSDGLARCGYPYCPGDVMATNPRWRAPLSTWQRHFGRWLDHPEPEALLNASIFFDMRHVCGDGVLAETLQRGVLEQTQRNSLFLAYMAKNALEHAPPLGFFRQFVLETSGEHTRTFNLKFRGVVPVTDLARVYALGAGVAEANTQARLALAAEYGALSREGASNLKGALEFISHVRLRHQAEQVRSGAAPDNAVSPDTLSPFERRHLKDAFHIVSTMQAALSERYGAGRLA